MDARRISARNQKAVVTEAMTPTWEEMHFPSYGLVLDDPSIDPPRVVRSAGTP